MSVREIIAAVFIIAGLLVFICAVFGIFRLKYVMNRIHAAALGDTMGIALICVGLLIMGQNVYHILKYVLIVLFFWLSSPIATHMIGKVEMLTNKDSKERVHEK